ncbi:hypothetical protein COV61_01185 [Candidatus Micrarchaeota archaeon CG11_big_fil_rev_8_21_14_0_20_47_5]|nr:MAG: hypothetical protein COV61_01185 [Candidatus Micrarchaeota archaeon CG11_big_fil_rev_8_21_14_0_20_47_5]
MTGADLELLKKAGQIAKKKGTVALFDPGRSKSREGEGRLAPILKNCDYLFANRSEILLIGGKGDAKETARRLAGEYGVTCVLKAGRDEIFVAGEEEFSLSPPRVNPVDTIGAGDAFSAGFICGLNEGKNLRDCVKMAMWSAVQKIMYRGAQSGISRGWVRKRAGV